MTVRGARVWIEALVGGGAIAGAPVATNPAVPEVAAIELESTLRALVKAVVVMLTEPLVAPHSGT